MPPPEPSLPPALVAAWVALIGAVVGSFLNVVVARVPAGESVVSPRSRCPRCRTPIAWYDNLPVLSWFLLRGRCRACRLPISFRYPAVEAAIGGAAVLAWSRHGLSLAALAELALASLLVALALIDLDTWLLPHALTWPLIVLGLAASAAGAAEAPGLRSAALGAAVGFGAFALLSLGAERLLRKEALGFGDVWLLCGIGAWLGIGALLPVVLLASIQGSVVGLVALALGRGEPGPDPAAGAAAAPAGGAVDAPDAPAEVRAEVPAEAPADVPADGAATADDDWVPPRHALPFGPFLAAGALEWLYLGEALARAFPVLRAFR